jgi:phosphoglycolate phosphatase
MSSRLFVFDLDGTLVDSVPDLMAAVNRSLATHRAPPLPRDAIAPMMGDGARTLMERGFAARGLTPTAAEVEAYLADYLAHVAVETRFYPGVPEGLRRLASEGWGLAVCTNKPAAPTRALLAALGAEDWFAAVGAGDSFGAKKPDPAHLLGTVAAAGGTPARAIMMGDHANDIRAAQGAGMPGIFAAWGYGAPQMAAGAAALAQNFAEAAQIAARLLP